MDAMLKLQEILNLLPTTLIFPFSDLPDPPFNYRVYLSSLPFSFFGLLVFIQEDLKPVRFNRFYPDADGFPVLT